MRQDSHGVCSTVRRKPGGKDERQEVSPNIKLMHQSKQTLKVRASDTKGNDAKWRTRLLFDPHQRAVMRNTLPTATALEQQIISSSGVISFAGDGALFAEFNNEQPFTPALLFFFPVRPGAAA